MKPLRIFLVVLVALGLAGCVLHRPYGARRIRYDGGYHRQHDGHRYRGHRGDHDSYDRYDRRRGNRGRHGR